MNDEKELYETLSGRAFNLGLKKPDIPNFIKKNIKYDLFEWQKKALENLITYDLVKSKEEIFEPTHLLFNMATGSGKTLVMASALLYYYKKGYRHFIFFVNANNVVDKTENNFLSKQHNKYLFNEKIVIDNSNVNIKKVDVFTDNTNDIEIKFTTIQQLYNDIHVVKENQTTLSDLHKKDVVMLADEAHHLNANTKRNDQTELDYIEKITNRTSLNDVEKKGWEHTVIELILNKNGNYNSNNNVLLEFTATMPDDKRVYDKYKDKIIYKFALKEFLEAGYTKEINLISSTLDKKERILQALLFHWYRHKIALKHGLMNFKPVILFRSKTIKESRDDFKYFLSMVENLTIEDLEFIKKIENKLHESDSPYEQGTSRTQDVIEYIIREEIHYGEIVEFIKYNFQTKNSIITNSKDNKAKTIEKTSEDQEKLLNNLESKDNNIRAIFTVKRLTEGWDVLNLYDIVRLYEGQNSGGSTKKTPEATVQEKQLIGRGVRYYPFSYKNKLANKRKFDNDIKNELRVLEELYYYTYDEKSRYITHLKKELRKDGYIQNNKEIKTFKLKQEFKENKIYSKIKIWYNQKQPNPNRRKNNLNNIKDNNIFTYETYQLELNEEEVNLMDNDDKERLHVKSNDRFSIQKKIKDFEKHIFRKAINIKSQEPQSVFKFSNLKKELDIRSCEELTENKFLGDFEITIIIDKPTKFELISNQIKLNILLKFLNDISLKLRKTINPFMGSEFMPGNLEMFFGDPKTKVILANENSKIKEEILQKKDWYALDSFYGTDQEIELIDFLSNTIKNLQKKYQDVYLLRNEEVYKIYDFENGKGFQPDFILIMRDRDKNELNYQIFIEPKGGHLMKNDEWKNSFLKEITKKYSINDILRFGNSRYKIIGLPLFNSNDNIEFNNEYKKLI